MLAVLLIGATAAAIGCSDAREAPLGPGEVSRHRAGPGTPVVVPVLQRVKPLAEDVTVRERIGWTGGTIRIAEAGLRVRIPAGAIPLEDRHRKIEITVTALKGGQVAYTFAPHGLTFRRPIEMVQESRFTTAPRGGFQRVVGAYFPDPSALGATTATVTEFRPTSFEKRRQLVWTAEHFSGYLLASQ